MHAEHLISETLKFCTNCGEQLRQKTEKMDTPPSKIIGQNVIRAQTKRSGSRLTITVVSPTKPGLIKETTNLPFLLDRDGH